LHFPEDEGDGFPARLFFGEGWARLLARVAIHFSPARVTIPSFLGAVIPCRGDIFRKRGEVRRVFNNW